MRAIRRHFTGMCNKWKKSRRVSIFLICLLFSLPLSHPFCLFHAPFSSHTLSLVRLLAHSRIKGSSFRFDSIWNIDTAKECCCLVKWGTNDLSNILRVFGAFGRVKYWSERHTHRERELKLNEAIQRSYGFGNHWHINIVDIILSKIRANNLFIIERIHLKHGDKSTILPNKKKRTVENSPFE